MLCYVTTLTEEDRRLCRKQLIMFCDKVYILFSNWYSRNTRIQLLFWQVMLSFYLKAEKCLQKKQKQMQQLLRNTINFIFKNVKLISGLSMNNGEENWTKWLLLNEFKSQNLFKSKNVSLSLALCHVGNAVLLVQSRNICWSTVTELCLKNMELM